MYSSFYICIPTFQKSFKNTYVRRTFNLLLRIVYPTYFFVDKSFQLRENSKLKMLTLKTFQFFYDMLFMYKRLLRNPIYSHVTAEIQYTQVRFCKSFMKNHSKHILQNRKKFASKEREK